MCETSYEDTSNWPNFYSFDPLDSFLESFWCTSASLNCYFTPFLDWFLSISVNLQKVRYNNKDSLRRELRMQDFPKPSILVFVSIAKGVYLIGLILHKCWKRWLRLQNVYVIVEKYLKSGALIFWKITRTK